MPWDGQAGDVAPLGCRAYVLEAQVNVLQKLGVE